MGFYTYWWVLRHTAWIPNFTFTRLNLSLFLLSVLGIRHCRYLKSLEQKETDCTSFAKKFCIDFSTGAFKENLHIFSFPWIQIKFLKILQIFEFGASIGCNIWMIFYDPRWMLQLLNLYGWYVLRYKLFLTIFSL